MKRYFFIFPLLFFFTISCGNNLHSTSLKTAVLNESYYDSLFLEEDFWYWDDDIAFVLKKGGLPPGIFLGSNGTLSGTPTAVGDFGFVVTAYTFDNNFFDEDEVYEDSEWFVLFVTESSTNVSCPSPGDTTTNEFHICLGSLEEESLTTGDTLTLDVNYFIDFNKASDYSIYSLEFSIYYDTENFSFPDELLTSQTLRETATRTNALVTFSKPTEGELNIRIEAQAKDLHKSGRLLDLPLTVNQDLAAGDYDFTVSILDIGSSKSDVNLPGLVEIDGVVSVEEDAVSETE